MSLLKSVSDHLTLNADGTSKSIKFQSAGVEKASISSAGAFTSTTIDATVLTGALPAISGASLTGLVALSADNSWGGSQRGTIVTDNDGSFDMNASNNFSCTPAGAITLTFTNIASGQSGFILMINSGGQTISAAATTKVDANLLATITAAGTYLISYFSNGTNAYLTNSAIYA
jgi:hypothetical protein